VDLLTLDIPEVRKVARGKVREIFDLGEHLLFAFDCVLPNAIPHKGAVLTKLSCFWFSQMDFVANHIVTADFEKFPVALRRYEQQLRGRAIVVRKAQPLPIECVVRGYLAGSAWKEYQAVQSVCGIKLPPGLRQAEQLPEPIFTPATKAPSGHDENITWELCCSLVGREMAERVRELSLRIYNDGRALAAERGIILADTKFEFGLMRDGDTILIDECLTPDSSRLWPASEYRLDTSPPSFDKQYVRDYLETLDWNKTPPAPALPPEVVQRTSEKYLEAYERLTGAKLPTG
jgi:phosphoribosylaminoimidazole-succinocarboxamide synthase